VGGFGVIGAVLGFLFVRAVIDLRNLPADWTLFALPVFGVCGVVGFVVFVSAFLGLE
jgi:ammonia channel protein AmtB